MKHDKNYNNSISSDAPLKPVRFEFKHTTARTVCVAGCFNEWNATSKPMRDLGNGHWFKETALPAGNYEYCLVVDGVWMPDPVARETVRNPYGGQNSVLRVASSPVTEHLANAENSPLKNEIKLETWKL